MQNLTELEIKILQASRTNEYCDAVDEGAPWVFAVIEESGILVNQARGVIASLVKKGIVIVEDYENKGKSDDMVFVLTDEGAEITRNL